MPQVQFETDDAKLAALIDELRVIAHAARRRLPVGETLATTALVNEAFLKLSRPNSANAVDQRHFFALAARAMREILIDEARRRAMSQAQRHADTALMAEPLWLAPNLDAERLVAMDQAMRGLAEIQPRLAEVVNCRFFAGYTEVETADILGVDVRTVQRDWQRARAWLAELTP
jgi:RNA polymerase sigma factor (TIGR02999 family)